jgi:hypothetical protein
MKEMEMADENDLTPEEEMAFQRLPRELEPSRILEERVVKALREEGVLRAAQVETGQPATATSPWLRPWMVAVSVAASLVLFASGVFFGQRMGSMTTAEAFIQVREQDAAQVALRIQEAGSAYVAALAALSEFEPAGQGGGRSEQAASMEGVGLRQGREVALGALYGAVNELARMSPDDVDVLRVLQILEERQAREEGRGGAGRNVVWF